MQVVIEGDVLGVADTHADDDAEIVTFSWHCPFDDDGESECGAASHDSKAVVSKGLTEVISDTQCPLPPNKPRRVHLAFVDRIKARITELEARL